MKEILCSQSVVDVFSLVFPNVPQSPGEACMGEDSECLFNFRIEISTECVVILGPNSQKLEINLSTT